MTYITKIDILQIIINYISSIDMLNFALLINEENEKKEYSKLISRLEINFDEVHDTTIELLSKLSEIISDTDILWLILQHN